MCVVSVKKYTNTNTGRFCDRFLILKSYLLHKEKKAFSRVSQKSGGWVKRQGLHLHELNILLETNSSLSGPDAGMKRGKEDACRYRK